MLADVLVPRSSRKLSIHAGFYTYRVPHALTALVQPGQLVAVPFGEEAAPGIIWGLDASDDAMREAETAQGDASLAADRKLRALDAILIAEPLLGATQRALAEWLADYYIAPLSDCARLLLPPGLLSSLRIVVRPSERTLPDNSDDTACAPIPGDEAVLLALLRECGWLERRQVKQALGSKRAQAALHALLVRGAIMLSVELAEGLALGRHERVAWLAGDMTEVEAWRLAARSQLDALPSPLAARRGRKRADPEERAAERLLRQLAVLDVLSGPGMGSAPGDAGASWRVEDLRRLTRATQGALDELVAAGLVAIAEREVTHDPLAGRRIAHSEPLPLTLAQAQALATILGRRDTRHPAFGIDVPGRSNRMAEAAKDTHVLLLHGITGSGKTEIYLQALAAVIAQGRRGIVLVPEIALTPQAIARFAGRFPGRVALLHSGLTPAERLDEWRRIRAGQVDVVVGSRSALFAPIEPLGLIVVDEEHEAAYKEEQRAPTYHARDVAVRLGALAGATVVLGSATPSVESYWQASQGVYQLVELRERAGARPPAGLPPVTLVDLRAELRVGNTSILSEALRSALHQTLERGEQAILFLNRRGMASSVVCRECGYVAVCGRCDVAMTYHAAESVILCHYCGKREPVPQTCPVCWSASIRYFGVGTERVESAVKRQFPAARVLRWDHDTARTRHAHEELLHAFAERRADVLVGTQMIAKGLDLPAVTLVGVVSADVALFLPDFRASERAFQLLTQVAGRAGRGDLPGKVLVQTLNPEHFCVQSAAQHDYAGFFAAEVAARQRYAYPPFRRFVKYLYAHHDRYTAQIEATILAERIERMIHDLALPDTDLVGPAPAFMERLRGRYRWQVMVRSPDPRALLRALAAEGLPYGWSVDVDPATSL